MLLQRTPTIGSGSLVRGNGSGKVYNPAALAAPRHPRLLHGPPCAQLQAGNTSSPWQSAAGSAAGAALGLALMLGSSLGAPPAAMAEVGVRAALVSPTSDSAIQLALERGLDAQEINSVKLFQANTPTVVNVTNIRMVRSPTLDTREVPVGLGSGFIWDTQGHVITNFHVVKGASDVRVTLVDQASYPAKVVGVDPEKDVAVLKLDAPEEVLRVLRPVSLGSSKDLLVGQKVFAIGNPFGLDHTLSQGIISGLGRELNTGIYPIKGVIQTDASINPGNSGGVLLDSQGRLIGINTAIADPTGKGSSSGVGFAIPIDMVKGLVGQILEFGRTMRPALGITIAPPGILQQLDQDGVLVLDVPEGTPAAKAGIEPTQIRTGQSKLGDIIVGIDGQPIRRYEDLFTILDDKRVGETVTVDIIRGASKVQVKVTLGERIIGQAE